MGCEGAVGLDDLALALDAVAGLEVVPVLQAGLGAGPDGGVGDRVPQAVGLEEEPAAEAVAPVDRGHPVEMADDHDVAPWGVIAAVVSGLRSRRRRGGHRPRRGRRPALDPVDGGGADHGGIRPEVVHGGDVDRGAHAEADGDERGLGGPQLGDGPGQGGEAADAGERPLRP